MDQLIQSVVTMLCTYALDKGAELVKDVGPKALDTAGEMFTLVVDRLRRKPDGEFVLRKLEENAVVYQKPLEEELAEELSSDPDFADALKTLLSQYEDSAREHVVAMGTSNQAAVRSGGAVAQGKGAVAAGAGGIAVGGDVHGGVVITGHGNAIEKKTPSEGEGR
jgi:hypothetical protein